MTETILSWFAILVITVVAANYWIKKRPSENLRLYHVWARLPTQWYEVGCQFATSADKVDLELASRMYYGCTLLVLEPWEKPWIEQSV